MCPPKCGEQLRAGFAHSSANVALCFRTYNLPHPYVMKPHRYLVPLTLIAVAGPIIGADVLTNWKEHCAKCHGDDGKGETKMGRKLSIRDLSDPGVQAKFTDEAALKAIKEGVTDKDGKVTMKPIEGLAADEMPALVKHVRGLVKK